jgi:hypothetical protein
MGSLIYTYVHLLFLAEFFLEWEMSQTIFV